MKLCDVENKHLVVLDTFRQLTLQPRTMPGDCWCTRCQQEVPFWFNNGEPVPALEVPADDLETAEISE